MVLFDALVAGHIRQRGARAFVTVLAIALAVAIYLGLRLQSDRAVAAFSAQTGVFGDEADFSAVPGFGTLPFSLAGRLRAVAGIDSVTPAIEGQAVVDGETLHVAGRDLLAPLPRTLEFRTVLPGPFASIGSGPDPALLLDGAGTFFSTAFAQRHRLHVGDVVRARAAGAFANLRVAALVPPGAVLDPNVAIVDVHTAQRLFGPGLDRIDVGVRPGYAGAVRPALMRSVPAGVSILSAGERRAGVERMAGGFEFDLALLGAFALLAASVIACDAIGISVVQRRAEIGTLRVLGATRFAIARTFLFEGTLLGALGGLFGTVSGGIFGAAGDGFAPGSDLFAVDRIAPIAAFGVGVLLGLCGAIPPAIAGASERPDRAVRARAENPHASRDLETLARAGAACAAAAALLLAVALTRTPVRTELCGVACIGFACAVALALPWILHRSTLLVAARDTDAPPPIALAIANVRASPRRIALGVAALAFGVALATAALAISASFRNAIVDWADASARGDLAVTPFAGSGASRSVRFPASLESRVRAVPGVTSLRATRSLSLSDGGIRVVVMRDDADAGVRPNASRRADGELDAVVDSAFAARHALRAGDTFALPVAHGTRPAKVTRVRGADPFATETIVLDRTAFASAYGDDTSDRLELTIDDAANATQIAARVRAVLAPRTVDVAASRELRSRLIARFDPIVVETRVLASVALALGAVGIFTTLSALALERRDLIRLLRTSGLTRAGVRTMIVSEAAALGGFGAATGIALGLVVTIVMLEVDLAAFGWRIVPVVPVGGLTLTFVASVALAALAGLSPARFASRLVTPRAVRNVAIAILTVAACVRATSFASGRHAENARIAAGASDIWRVEGQLRALDGRRFGVAVTFFRYPLSTSPHDRSGNGFDAAALSIVDEDARQTITGVRVEREGIGLAHARPSPLDLRVDDWTLRATRAGRLAPQTLRVGEGDTSFEGTLNETVSPTALDPPPPQAAATRDAGLQPGFASTRVAASGVLVTGGRRIAVRGLFWIDREERSAPIVLDENTWRVTIQLDDGRAVFLRGTRRGSKGLVIATGFVRAANGTVTYLTSRDVYLFNPMRTTWRNAHGEPYPSLFEAIVPRLNLDLAIDPVVQDGEIDGHGRGLPFFDAPVDVERASPGPRDTGVGYVELAGYAGAIRPSL